MQRSKKLHAAVFKMDFYLSFAYLHNKVYGEVLDDQFRESIVICQILFKQSWLYIVFL